MASKLSLSHSGSVRSEILERRRPRDQYVVLYGTAVAVFAGIVAGQLTQIWALLVIPFLSLVTSVLYAHTDVAIGRLGRWLETSYSTALPSTSSGERIPHWDASIEHHAFIKSPEFQARYRSLAWLLFIPSAAASLAIGAAAPGQVRVRSGIALAATSVSALAAWRMIGAGRTRIRQLG